MKLSKISFQQPQNLQNESSKPPKKNLSRLRKNIALALVAGLTMCNWNPAFANEEDNNQEYYFDQVVVTATRTEKSIKDVAYAVEVITKEEMEKLSIKRVDDALKYLTGVYVRQSRGLVGGSSTDKITMRGFSKQSQILYLVDGKPANIAYNGEISLPNIPIENIERIEVLKGPASALYGSNAMGGVINIITNQKAKDETVIRMGLGEMHTNSNSILTSGTIGKLEYFLSAQGNSTDGYPNNYNRAGVPSNDGNNGMNSEMYNAKFVYRPGENNKIGLSTGKSRYRYFSENNPTSNGYSNQEDWSLDYEHKLGADDFLNLTYSKKEVEAGYTSSTTIARTPSSAGFAEIQYKTKLSPKDLFILGYALRTEQADNITTSSSGKVGGKAKTNSFFFQNERQAGEKTAVYLGARYDKWDFYDAYTDRPATGFNKTPEQSADSFNPQIGVVHKINDKATLRSSIGTSFRTPTIYELSTSWENATQIYRNNPNIKPEKSVNYEVGLDYEFDKTLVGKFSVYHSDISDSISRYSFPDPAGSGKTINQLDNASKARVNGFELGINKNLSDSWNTFFNYSYNDAKMTESESTSLKPYVGQQLEGVPKNMFNLGVDYNKGAWGASVVGSYVSESNSNANRFRKETNGPQRYESYFVLNTKVSYKISNDAILSLSIDNLLDREYYTYYLSPGRTAYVELMYKF